MARFRLFHRSLAAASLVLLLATVAIWVRSRWNSDGCYLTTYAVVPADVPDPYKADESIYENSERPEGRLVRKEQEARSDLRRRVNCNYLVNVGQGGAYFSWEISDLSLYAGAPQLDWNSYDDPGQYFGGGYAQSTFAGQHWGWHYVEHPREIGASGGSRDASRERSVLFPLWAAAAFFAIAPSFWIAGVFVRQRRAARRRRLGKCRGCGYDLRASPQRCPECGRIADTPSEAGSPAVSKPMHGWGHELLPLWAGPLLLLALGGAGYWLFLTRFAAMERLYAGDMKFQAAAQSAETAMKDNDAPALRAALAAGPVYGPSETAQLLRGLVSEKDRVGLALVLLDNGLDVRDLPGLLSEAIGDGNYALARALVAKGADVNGERDDPPLARCLSSGDDAEALELFELLLKHGANPSGRTDPKSWTLLHRLVQGGQTLFPDRVRMAELLIAKGADVNATASDEGMTPLCLANEDDPDPLIRLLKSKGAMRYEKPSHSKP